MNSTGKYIIYGAVLTLVGNLIGRRRFMSHLSKGRLSLRDRWNESGWRKIQMRKGDILISEPLVFLCGQYSGEVWNERDRNVLSENVRNRLLWPRGHRRASCDVRLNPYTSIRRTIPGQVKSAYMLIWFQIGWKDVNSLKCLTYILEYIGEVRKDETAVLRESTKNLSRAMRRTVLLWSQSDRVICSLSVMENKIYRYVFGKIYSRTGRITYFIH